MAIKISVDCMHNGGRISVSSSRRPDTPFSLAKAVCELLNNDGGFSAFMPEKSCISRFGSDSIRGRISIACEEEPACHICFHSNPSGRYRGCGIAAHIRQGDMTAEKIAESILNRVSETTNLNPMGIYHGNGMIFNESLPHPVILELAFNPYSSGFTPYRQELSKLPEAVFAGIKSVFVPEFPQNDENFQEYLDRNSGSGFVKVQVLAGRSEVPLAESRIVITKKLNGNSYTLADLTTDINGMTPNISLPAPPAYLSQSPGNSDPYAFYDIEISRPGFITQNDIDVPVFDRVLSIQNARLNAISSEGGM